MITMPRAAYNRAFSIIELAVVIFILGILAAIAVMAWGAWRDNVAETEIRSDLNNLYAVMESEKNRNNAYTVLTVGSTFSETGPAKNIYVQSPSVVLSYANGTATGYCINGSHSQRPEKNMYLKVQNTTKTIENGTCPAVP